MSKMDRRKSDWAIRKERKARQNAALQHHACGVGPWPPGQLVVGRGSTSSSSSSIVRAVAVAARPLVLPVVRAQMVPAAATNASEEGNAGSSAGPSGQHGWHSVRAPWCNVATWLAYGCQHGGRHREDRLRKCWWSA